MLAMRYAFKNIRLGLPPTRLGNVLLAGMIFIICSCSEKSQDSYPKIELVNNASYISHDTTIKPGSSMQFAIEAYADQLTLTNFLVKVQADSTVIYFDTGVYTDQLFWKGKFIKSTASPEKWRFVIRDRLGNVDETNIIIKSDTSPEYGQIETVENLILGAQNNENDGLYSLKVKSTYEYAVASESTEIQELIDLIYYLGEDELTITSPGANIEDGIFQTSIQEWTVRNTCRFLKLDLSESEFNNIVNDSLLISDYNESLAKWKSKYLEVGKVFVFRTQNNTLGIFRVNEVIGQAEGTINISLKFQEKE